MKKLLLFMVCIVFIFASCAKKADVKSVIVHDFISANIDGVNENFNIIDSAGYNNKPGLYSLSIWASASTDDSADQINLVVNNKTPITTGTYALTAGSYNPPYVPLIVYKTNGGNNFADDYVIDYTGAHQAAITITAISSTNVQGTFNGTLVVAAGTSGAVKTIANGKFNLDMK